MTSLFNLVEDLQYICHLKQVIQSALGLTKLNITNRKFDSGTLLSVYCASTIILMSVCIHVMSAIPQVQFRLKVDHFISHDQDPFLLTLFVHYKGFCSFLISSSRVKKYWNVLRFMFFLLSEVLVKLNNRNGISTYYLNLN